MFEKITGIRLGPKSLTDRKHANITNNLLLSIAGKDEDQITDHIKEAAKIRHSLG